ncbi:MAG TPA: hypothetical protein VM166_12140 [Gemmatimonadaceae bacterium]|nr:hypothetical protein [Gemmatimonadaceae bacterium]
MKNSSFLFLASLCIAGSAGAQTLPPIRQLGPVTRVGTEPLGAVSSVRQLPGGRVLVNDIVGRRVVLFDSTLTQFTVVADTTSATANAYGARPGGLIPFRGDSTLFVDPASLSMLVIDPNGKMGRVMSVPRANDAGFLIGGPFGFPGFDQQGRLIYRAPPRINFTGGGGPGRMPQIPQPPDSAAIVRVDLATRSVDTLTWFKTPKIQMQMTHTPDGGVRINASMNPFPQTDDWAVLPDGTIALVRTKDYHVDFLSPDGKLTSAPKIPFQWERLTDSAKVAVIDSARAALERNRANAAAGGAAGAALSGGGFAVQIGGPESRAERTRAGAPAAPAPSPTAQPGTATITTGGNTTVTAIGPGGAGLGGPGFMPTMVSPTDLPDYRPAFGPGSIRTDAEGNLWIRTSQNVDARPVYNVVNREGALIDRVQLPKNRVLAGFGTGGVVYLAVRDGTTAHLEAARVK